MNARQPVRVRYYALLRAEAGQAEETLETGAATLLDLWNEVRARHGFSLDVSLVRPALDDEFCSWDEAVKPGSLVVFMPPVAGG